MCSSGQKLDLKKCLLPVACKRTVFRVDRLCIFCLVFKNFDLVGFFVFQKPGSDILLFFYHTFYDTKIIFMQGTFFEKSGKDLQTLQSLTCRHDPARIAVQAVTQGWAECF